MASTQPKSTSRWGSLLQQAVAGVESRLDTILADDDKPLGITAKVDNAAQPGRRETMVLPSTARSSSGMCPQARWTYGSPNRIN